MAPLFRLLFSVSHALDSVCLDLCPPLLREGVCTSWAGLLGLGGGLRGGRGRGEARRGRVCKGGGEEGLGALWAG